MAGVFDHLHLKRHTAGSSNELSFDVLDAAKGDLDTKPARKGFSPFQRQPTKTYEGVPGPVAVSSSGVQEKEKSPAAAGLVVAGAAIVFALVLAFAMVIAGYRFSVASQSVEQRIAREAEALAGTDAIAVQLDDYLAALSDDPASDALPPDEDALQEAGEELGKITSEAEALLDRTDDQAEQAALQSLAQEATARAEMIDVVRAVADVQAQMSYEIEKANSIWAEVVAADQAARAATQEANAADTERAIKTASRDTQKALDRFANASTDLQGTVAFVLGPDFSDQVAFLQKKSEALGHAVSTADALVAGDREKARKENDAYNEADQAAAKLAASLPPSLEEPVQKAAAQQIADQMVLYRESRATAESARKTLNAYLSD